MFFAGQVLCLLGQKSDMQNFIPFVSDSDFNNALISISLIDIETGSLLGEHQSDMSLVPASSMKVITTATALAVLGKDFKFKTELQYDGEILKDGTLKGNIYIKGFGDPTLGAEKPEGNIPYVQLMSEWATKIKALGIRKIEGKVIGDASAFEYAVLAPTWQWNDIGNYYGAGASGLNINANTYELEFKQNPQLNGRPAVNTVTPNIPNLYLINEVVSAGRNSGDNCYIYGAPYQYVRYLRGSIPLGNGKFTVKGSIPEPAFTAAMLLLEELENQGVATNKIATTQLEEFQSGNTTSVNRKSIHVHHSLPLSQIMKITNEESINLYCEAMLKMLGLKQKGEGSLEKGIETIKEYWEDKGLDTKGFFMEDGSGLSPRNGITSKQFASILKLVAKDKALFNDFKNTLPLAGQTGTLKFMFRNSPAKGRIWAKTGSMRRIRSYTGYVKANSGKWLAFSVMVNNYTCSSAAARKKLEKIMESFLTY